jgi:hypothetical protein
MAIQERAPRPQRREQHQSPEASIASHVAGIVGNLQKDRQAIPNPYDLCIRADMAMVATLQLVAPALPDAVREQVNQLISIHDELYQATRPSTEQPTQEHEQGTSPQTIYQEHRQLSTAGRKHLKLCTEP